ncbi:hypothetical protein HYY69_07795 [Candidatus Woesearchaeota archaeon]|nr:hypothetical protein [Candidatus Woesearchaeota archaeon]
MKCEICSNKLEETFLNKIVGTYLKDKQGKQHAICFECQHKFHNNKEEMLKDL